MLHGGVNTGFEARRRRLPQPDASNTATATRPTAPAPTACASTPPRVTQRLGDADAKDVLPVAQRRAAARRRRAVLRSAAVRARRRFVGLLPQRRRRPHRARPVSQRLPAEHHHHGRGRLARGRLPQAAQRCTGTCDLSVNHGTQRVRVPRNATRSTSAGGTSRSIRSIRPRGIYGESPIEADTGTLEFDADDRQPRLPRQRRLGHRRQPAVPGHRRGMAPGRLRDRSGRPGVVHVRPHQQPRHPDLRPDRRHRAAGHPGLPRLLAARSGRRRPPQLGGLPRRRVQADQELPARRGDRVTRTTRTSAAPSPASCRRAST